MHQHRNGSNVVFNKKVFIFLLNYAFILLVLIVSYICLSFFYWQICVCGGGGIVTSEAGCKTKEDADDVKSCEIIKYSPNICVTLSVQKHYRPHSSFQVSDRDCM